MRVGGKRRGHVTQKTRCRRQVRHAGAGCKSRQRAGGEQIKVIVESRNMHDEVRNALRMA